MLSFRKKHTNIIAKMSQPVSQINKIDESEVVILKKRIDIATAVIITLIASLVFRLWYLQIYQGDKYSKLSEKNRIRVMDIGAPRGNIRDAQDRTLITNRPCFNVVWIREDAPDPDAVIKAMAGILHTDASTIHDRIRNSVDRPRYMPLRLGEDIDWKTLIFIENHSYELPGVRIEVLPSRDYLYEDLASHLIGYIGEISLDELKDERYANYKQGDQVGKQGIEKIYEPSLRGEKGRRFMEVDVHGFEQRELKSQFPKPGNDLKLTIDIDLQRAAEKALEGKAGAIVVMEVNTGKILALASAPTLSLKQFVGGISAKAWDALLKDEKHPLLNKTIQGVYPPGSTYKIATALAGLSEGVITPETTLSCSGSYFFGNRSYGCWKKGGHGSVNLHRAIAESCDVYFYQVGLRLGINKLALYAESLGLGKKSGIELENEKEGNVPTTEWKLKRRKEPWQEGETLSAAIGQGFDLATPLQITRMTAAIVNGGILYRPQLIEAVVDLEGNPVTTFAPIMEGKTLGSERHRKLIRDGLVAVVNEQRGTGQKAKLKDIKVGGKTGTAQVVHLRDSKRTEVLDDIPYKYRDHAWFTCFAPAEKPEIAVTVLLEHGGHGGSTAAPLAKVVLSNYFKLDGSATPTVSTAAGAASNPASQAKTAPGTTSTTPSGAASIPMINPAKKVKKIVSSSPDGTPQKRE